LCVFQLLWYQDTLLLDPTDRRKMESRGNKHTLNIRNVQGSDFGNYSCVADNSLGRAKKYMELSGRTIKQLFLVNDQCDAQFFSMYLFIFLTLCMFRAHRAHHQERQIVSIQPLVAVTVCRWLFRVQVGSFTSDLHTTQPPTATRGCNDTICLS